MTVGEAWLQIMLALRVDPGDAERAATGWDGGWRERGPTVRTPRSCSARCGTRPRTPRSSPMPCRRGRPTIRSSRWPDRASTSGSPATPLGSPPSAPRSSPYHGSRMSGSRGSWREVEFPAESSASTGASSRVCRARVRPSPVPPVESSRIEEPILDQLEVSVEGQRLIVDTGADPRADHDPRDAEPVPVLVDRRRSDVI